MLAAWFTVRRQDWCDIGMSKVVADEQEGFVPGFREGIRETIAEVEVGATGVVPTTSVTFIPLVEGVELVGVVGHYLNS